MNRLYALVYPESIHFGLNLTGALVLSLQGLWNSLIYVSTSFPLCRGIWAAKFPSGTNRNTYTLEIR
jgi:hypothetical protein